ncbi:methyltransferase domain-containing protein [Staphylococcus pettenkoferi]|uniref:class I SAM-dependent methyltransferase n=1 Tax=Staphylococcus pettenkoferi TaxID=170573 RepID=UPI00066C8C8E|nr:class I SAM-dependent methyltransferase [Staphylococcus pettenkoferi]MCY1567373.1 methyltransferase domain-containing protein [Staphylococcus pettenkoferi]MCY1588230.1 methyltransferase domain-containing protein [Staphylococcus pettenkoferi]MCY1591011.1 methyltransferase domain-containing protein [Staphylococcus pettenkoferi]MCY1597273.1 methyltransferase domain-containing protein [Staphylococcus pettenkoferi]MCY1598328.1 methyltransferase domain-containing protein [Staphylococcus pettenkof
MKKEAGHTFLAKLGKKRLRPGGRKATDWLIKKGHFTKDKRVLEVGCNMCTTAIQLAKTYSCNIEGVDLNAKALQQGQKNVEAANLSHLIHVQKANAMNLPFEDEQFDIILNEAMLTMLPLKAKVQALREYYRVLKPGGILLTHDIAIINLAQKEEIVENLSSAINVKVTPLPTAEWYQLFKDSRFSQIESHIGELTLMTPAGMLYDEGLFGTMKIVKNALKKENRNMFFTMFRTMKRYKKDMNYIVHAVKK